MKDLDFDELDKAVNSLMAGVKSDSPASEDKEKTLTIPPSSTPPSRSTASPLPRPTTPSTSQVAPASRRGGRFMDVVHPSSDMKKPENSRPSREGVTMEPRKETTLTETTPVSTQAPEAPLPVEEPKKETLAAVPSVQPHHETGDWPDPLDMMQNNDVANDVAQAKTEASHAAESASSQEETVDERKSTSPWNEAAASAKDQAEPHAEAEMAEPETKSAEGTPLTSPFLPGTKVEKRPLGANAVAASASDDLLTVDENAQLPATPKDVEPVLPAELHGDVMAIESDTTTKQPAAEEVSQPAEVQSSPWQQPEDKTTPSKPEGPAPAEVKKEEPKITGPTSIAQQYHEEPATGDQKNGAIYDTDNYHQPLAHPAKKKSGWMWIVWILLIIIVGAAAGAALYIFKIV